MNNRTKKWMVVAGCLAICAVLVVLIGGSFSKDPVWDAPLPATDAAAGEVTVDPGTQPSGAEIKDEPSPVVVVKPDTKTPAANPGDNGAVYTGTEQTIQPDVTKPEYDEKTLGDPAKTPDGNPVSESPKHEDHGSVQPPTNPPPKQGQPSGGTSGGLPGFDNVPDLGPNKEIPADDIRENGNKIGIMG